MSRYSFRIPASTSNLGAGFDALSLAVNLYLTVTIEEAGKFGIQARGVSVESIPTGPDNLILRVAQAVAARRAWTLPSFKISIENDIPLSRGLGSSAAAIMAGVTCYELITGDRLSDDEIFHYALGFEAHPDNLAAALYGGLVSAATSSAGTVYVARLAVAGGIAPLVVIPEFELSTEKARAVLPESYSREDAIYNIQRSALTIAALTTGKWEILREAMRDRIHEQYRAPLIPGLEKILALELPGLLGIALSGAGPSVMAFTEPERVKEVGSAIVSIFGASGVRSQAQPLIIDTKGRVIGKTS